MIRRTAAFLLWFALSPALFAEIQPTRGPAKGDLGGLAAVDVPAGYSFIEKKDCKEFMKVTGNLYSGTEMGVLIRDAEVGRFLVFFEFDDIGYIQDASKEKMDPGEMWASMSKGQESANKAREKKGYPKMEMVRWEKEPAYNPETQRLEWALWLRSEGKEFLNFNTRLLGRRGVMRVTLVPGENTTLASVMPAFNQLIGGFQFQAGHKYAEWMKGDKLAKVGLAALVVGGAGAAAANSGLIAKLIAKMGKLIVVVVVAVGAFLKKLWGIVTGRGQDEEAR
jgi:uncharacterized membrane-anchored protein